MVAIGSGVIGSDVIDSGAIGFSDASRESMSEIEDTSDVARSGTRYRKGEGAPFCLDFAAMGQSGIDIALGSGP